MADASARFHTHPIIQTIRAYPSVSLEKHGPQSLQI